MTVMESSYEKNTIKTHTLDITFGDMWIICGSEYNEWDN